MSLLNDLFTLHLPFFIGILFLYRIIWPKKSLKTLPPSPPKLPLIGNLHQIGSFPQRSLKSLAEKYGPIMLLHFGPKPAVIISSAEAAKEVMKTHDVSFADRPRTYAAGKIFYQFKDLSFSPYGEYWRQARGVCVLQLLSTKRVQSFKGIREEEVKSMVEKVRKCCDLSTAVNADELFGTLTNDIIGRAAFGIKFSTEEGGSKLRKLLKNIPPLLSAFNIGDHIPWLSWVNYINGFEAKLSKVAKDCDDYLENLVDQTRKKVESGDDEGELCQQNIASVLLQIQKENTTGFLSDKDFVKAIILDIIAGGTDTTYLLLYLIMAELLRNKDVMTKLQKEVREVLGKNSDVITDEDLQKMQYLNAVIKETLRFHPPVPLLVPREAREDVNLMGYHVKKGTQVIINAWGIGRDSCLWEEAEVFKPERFLNTSLDFKGHNFQYIPFGSGRRSCPGVNFAIPIAELALANLIHKFNFSLPDGVTAEDLDPTDVVGFISQKETPLSFIATGEKVIINAWGIGRDKSLWEKADKFKPERFLNTSFDFKGLNFQYIPFGSSRRLCNFDSRTCIGKFDAQIQLLIA
ncbi:hypothetical protein M9H77_09260 [Catharanthus roseus]|uniref:Uncharacterized protein n=1 Tax=Catharanthus roseus TaxID=4058 RepID=A0ACC0C075_CATRO|nr:hypothetical protein M9H77_09260 [Catharanthus roseus]